MPFESNVMLLPFSWSCVKKFLPFSCLIPPEISQKTSLAPSLLATSCSNLRLASISFCLTLSSNRFTSRSLSTSASNDSCFSVKGGALSGSLTCLRLAIVFAHLRFYSVTAASNSLGDKVYCYRRSLAALGFTYFYCSETDRLSPW